jgi:flagellar biosynthesis/type III secretory pathway M-ring protein FliF/YscJ
VLLAGVVVVVVLTVVLVVVAFVVVVVLEVAGGVRGVETEEPKESEEKGRELRSNQVSSCFLEDEEEYNPTFDGCGRCEEAKS